jgi:hypothetical protein
VQLSGEHRFRAPRSVVWEMLLDPAALQAAIPGCENLVEIGPGSYNLTVTVRISAIRGTFNGNVTVSDTVFEQSYRLTASGKGHPGSVRGEVQMTLEDDGGGTLLTWVAQLRAQGAVARFGSRLMGGIAKMMASRFFEAMEERMQERVS